MSARDNILARVRKGLGLPGNIPGAERDKARAYMAEQPRGPRPTYGWGDNVARFCERSEKLGSTVDRVASLAEVPQAVARYLQSKGLPVSAVAWPALQDMPWRTAGLEVQARAAQGSDLVGITGAFCAVAETGTLMLLSGEDTPATVSLLPETHIALVDVTRIVPGMEEAWALMKAERGTPPRAVNFVSGPSRTADIEQTIVIGAHGPYRVHVVCYG
ncbi:MAG: lactate utilization protein C [Betaproteobacteria bacterium]|nr:lactate utilization protein C [Betaproteobacteria bacterium]